MNVDEVKKSIITHEIRYLLAQFVDIHGVAKTKAVPVEHLESIFKDGAGFAGFAVDGLGIDPHGPDYMAVADPAAFRIMPWQPGFAKVSCSGVVRGKPHLQDSRVICQNALALLKDKTGHEFFSGLEPEFFLLTQDSTTGALAPAIAADTLDKPCYDFRILSRSSAFLMELSDSLIASGVDVYQIDHEDANGQFEVNFTFSDALSSADDMVFFKMAAAEIAHKHGLIASFMPKPFSNRPGSGMHMHMSMGNIDKNAFLDDRDASGMGLSKLAYHFLGGILDHAAAITAIACPSVNSYKRLVGSGSISGATWAPTSICYGDNNRTAMVRVPYGRLELRIPDSGCNPYLLTAAVVAAGLDGIERQLDPGLPINRNLYELSIDEQIASGINQLPNSLLDALEALEANDVLCNALGRPLVDDFCSLKRKEWSTFHAHISSWEIGRYLEFY